MITLLSRFFLKKGDDPADGRARQVYGMLCGIVGICLNLLLFAGKCAAGLLSHSIAILADAFNNLSDAASSVITLIGFKVSGQKPDSDHPFGHGRFEYISGLLVSVVILIMAFELVKSSFQKILHPQELAYSTLILMILAASIAVKCYMAYYNGTIGRKIQSPAMRATALDSLCDAIATTIVLASTLAAHYLGLTIDGYCGVLVGLFIGYAGVDAARDTINLLTGPAPDPEFVEKVKELVLSYQRILDVHDIIVHNYGPGQTLISLHAEVSAEEDFLSIHEVIDTVEHDLQERLHCHAVIHMDPVRTHDEETEQAKSWVLEGLHQLGEALTLHDFRLVKCATHTKVVFDVAAPYSCPLTDQELIDAMERYVQELGPAFRAVIEVDRV